MPGQPECEVTVALDAAILFSCHGVMDLIIRMQFLPATKG